MIYVDSSISVVGEVIVIGGFIIVLYVSCFNDCIGLVIGWNSVSKELIDV